MEWYWWVLIGVGVVVIGYFKLIVWGMFVTNKYTDFATLAGA